MKLLETTNVVLDVTDRQLTKYFVFDRYWRKKWEYNGTVHQLFINLKKAYDSDKKEVLCNILTKFAIPRN